MAARSIYIYRTYQTSTHRTLGFYTGDKEAVLSFCHLKFDIEPDDIALERVPVRKVTRSEVICFMEVMEQLRSQRDNAPSVDDDTAMENGMRLIGSE